MQLLSLLEAFRNGFTKPNVRHFTLLMVSLCALPSVTGSSVRPSPHVGEEPTHPALGYLRRFVRCLSRP